MNRRVDPPIKSEDDKLGGVGIVISTPPIYPKFVDDERNNDGTRLNRLA